MGNTSQHNFDGLNIKVAVPFVSEESGLAQDEWEEAKRYFIPA
jgi:hypothetical protein